MSEKSLSKRDQDQSAEEVKPTTELTDKELDGVAGGSTLTSPVLERACATGVHIKEATITH